jgi:6-phosphogluconate dehydrogenase
MQLGMIGLGRMGADMVRRLLRGGHDCVVYDRSAKAVALLAQDGAKGTQSPEEFIACLTTPRVVWLMVPSGAVDGAIEGILPLLAEGDTLVDGGNSYYHDDIRRAGELWPKGIHYLDVGTSGGVWGVERGYCLMIGGARETVARLEPLFATLAPGAAAALPTPGRADKESTAGQGYLHCGPSGAGHFVKMVHNGIEYGLMAAYAEGFNILRHANAGHEGRENDAETTPLRHPEHYQYDFNLGDIAELWRRGSVVASWLLDLSAKALLESPDLQGFTGRVSDSGEGRWTVSVAIDEGVPAPVLSAALFERFSSRGQADFADRLLSAMRYQFGGHQEKQTGTED